MVLVDGKVVKFIVPFKLNFSFEIFKYTLKQLFTC